MPDEAVPSSQWKEFCDAFSRSHRGWLVDLVESDRGGVGEPRSLAQAVRLQGVVLEDSDSEPRIYIALEPPSAHLDHAIDRVTRVVQLYEDTKHRGLRVEANDGRSVLIRFRAPASPEALDGLSPGER